MTFARFGDLTIGYTVDGKPVRPDPELIRFFDSVYAILNGGSIDIDLDTLQALSYRQIAPVPEESMAAPIATTPRPVARPVAVMPSPVRIRQI